MNIKATIVVLILAAIGVVAAVSVWRSEQGSTPGDDRHTPLLTAQQLPIDAVTRITLHRADEQAMVFERSEQGWRQVEPFSHPMDFFSVRQLVVLAAGLEVAQRLSSDQLGGELTDATLGLRPPRARLTYESPGGSLTLEFGRRGVAGRSYLRVAGDPTVYVINSDLQARAVDADPKEWRDRTIFPDVSVDADKVVIEDGSTRTVLVRDRKQWKMLEPVRTRLDDLARADLFSALGRAKSDGFILDEPADLSSFGLTAPAARLTITSTRQVEHDGEIVPVSQRQRLLVGLPMGVGSEDRFGMVENRPAVVRLPQAVLRSFFRRPESLADPTGSGVMAADVKSLVIRGPEGEFRLVRDLDRWSDAESGSEVRSAYVQDLLAQLTTQRAEKVEFRPYPRELEVATITMRGFDARPMDTVRIARDPQTGGWAIDNGDDVLRIFPAEMQIRTTPEDFGLQPATR